VMQSASLDCPCMKPVTETVYQDVQKVEYKPYQKTVKVAKVVTDYEDRPVTTYQTVSEPRTVDVQSFVPQQVTEMRPVTINQSYWQTSCQAIPKYSPCAYDSRPGLMGQMNRMGYSLRNTFTPNYVARREFVPNVVASQVPVSRTVQVPVTRQVTYNVSRQVAVQTTQKVAVQRTVWEDQTVTAYEPITTTQRVAVGSRTRMVYSGDIGGVTASAADPVPTAAKPDTSKGTIRQQSTSDNDIPLQNPTYRQDAVPAPQPHSPVVEEGPVASSDTNNVIRVAGWRASRKPAGDINTDKAADIAVVQK
ncbi:MAG TPA: hypothetical protein VNQ76_22545, partial [Planctomicrobium sp.]|nr:hypothetical protein [Planctomicrobium sp.]